MNYKEETNKVLLEYYKEHGLAPTIDIAKAMLLSDKYKNNMHFYTHTHGEICETILECILEDFFKKFGLSRYGWFYKKGLILKDINATESGYFTELDLTVFTPQKIFAFECKSYGGDKKITNKCTIVKKAGGSYDVYKQHSQHFNVLANQLAPFRIRNKGTLNHSAYQLILFNFSTGQTADVRNSEDKLIMPCLNENNVLNIFKLLVNQPVLWDIERVKKAVDIIDKHSAVNRAKHLSYVKKLRDKDAKN